MERDGRCPARARRLAWRGFRRAATAQVGAGCRPHPGAALHGAGVQTGGDGGGGDRLVGRARRLTGRGFKRAARAGGGRAPRSPARPAPTRGPYPLCRVCGRYRAEAGAACAPREHPDYIYQRVVSPEAPTAPAPITQSGQTGLLERTKTTSHPRTAPPRLPAPCFTALRAARTPDHRPDQGDPGLSGADPGRDARPGITGVLSRCAGCPSLPSPCVFGQVREGQRFRGQPASAPGRRGNGEPAAPARLDRPDPLCRARPTSRHALPPSPPV